MIETFEARQLFSVALDTTVTPTTDSATEQPAIVVDATASKPTGGKVTVRSFSFTHQMDKSSPVLM